MFQYYDEIVGGLMLTRNAIEMRESFQMAMAQRWQSISEKVALSKQLKWDFAIMWVPI